MFISRQSQSVVVYLLSAYLLVSPVYALPLVRSGGVLPVARPLLVPAITAAHQGTEVLVKFRESAARGWREEVRRNYGDESVQMISGPAQVERLTLKPGLDVAQTLAELQQLTSVVEWVEPNYLVQVASGRTGAREMGRESARRPSAPPVARSPRRAVSLSPLVAIIDTGIAASHPRLRRHLAAGWNVITDTATVNDDNGHGTQMAGIITRVHRQARLLPLKALDADGVGAISAVIAAMDRAVASHAQVILYSFGTEGKSQALLEAIQRAEMAGVVVVTAAGNDGQDLARVPQYPAAFTAPNLLTVAASNQKRELADFSNYGALAQVAAPGVDVATTTRPNALTRISGTSASAAYVAGVASRLKAVRPWVSATTVKQSIVRSARNLPALDAK